MSDVFPEALFPVTLLVREDVGSIPVDDGHQRGELQHTLVSEWPTSAGATGVVLNINEENHPPVVNGRPLVSQPCQGTWQAVMS